MIPALIAVCALAVVLLALCVWLFTSRGSLQRDLADTQTQRDTLTAENQSLGNEITEARQTIARLDEKVAGFDERLTEQRKQHEQAQQQAQAQFKALASDALSKAQTDFLRLANDNFKGKQKDANAELDQRKTAIENLLKPIREGLDKQSKAITEMDEKRAGAYAGLKQLVGTMIEDQKALRGETGNLVKALRRPDVRGRWGEMQLRRVAELAGMIDRCDFSEQHTTNTTDGRSLRPDMVVHLPAGREIVVDAKAPIDAYVSAIEAETDDDREGQLQRYVRHVEDKVTDLASKSYQSQFDRSPDFVVMFIPGESFLQAALQRKPELMDSAFNRGVVIATPSTLIALLKAVAAGWREEQVAESAKKVNDLGVELHARLATLSKHLGNLGKAVDKTVEHYNKFVGSYESQVMVQARRFQQLGADSNKELPAEGDLPQIETQPREVQEPEIVIKKAESVRQAGKNLATDEHG